MSLPFNISPEAKEYLIRTLKTQPCYELALIWCSQCQINGQECGEVVSLGLYDKGKRPRESFYSVLGVQVSISDTTYEKLAGEMLILEQKEIIEKGKKTTVPLLRIANLE